MNPQSNKRVVLRILSIVCALASLLTVIPFSGAEELSIMGYKSLCPFMPVSTIITSYTAFTIHRYLAHHRA